jgi:hypothetical protein
MAIHFRSHDGDGATKVLRPNVEAGGMMQALRMGRYTRTAQGLADQSEVVFPQGGHSRITVASNIARTGRDLDAALFQFTNGTLATFACLGIQVHDESADGQDAAAHQKYAPRGAWHRQLPSNRGT